MLTIFSALVYISLVFNNNVWMDEAFTATLVKTDYPGVLRRSMNDTLPPLYNLLLKLATDIFGYKVPVMKLLSASFMIILIAVSSPVINKRFGVKAASVFILALTFMPNMLFYGVEIRMYSLGFLFSTLSGVMAYECISDPCRKNWIIFTVISVLSGYSHHFALVAAGFVYLFMIIYYLLFERENIKRMIICIIASFLLYLPCLLVTAKQIKQVNGYFSMPEVTLSVFIKYMRYPYTVGFTPLSIILLLTVFALFIRLIYKLFKIKKRNAIAENGAGTQNDPVDTDGNTGSSYPDDKNKTSYISIDAGKNTAKDKYLIKNLYALSCFLIYYGVLVFGTIVSKIMTANIFVDRYLFFSMGLLWLFFALQASELKKPLYIAVIILELLVGTATYAEAFRSEYAKGADDLIAYLDQNVRDGDLLYTVEDAEGLSLSLPFYDDRLTDYEELNALREASGSGHTIWCAVLDGYEYSPEELEGLKLYPVGDFSFDRYTFKLYKTEFIN